MSSQPREKDKNKDREANGGTPLRMSTDITHIRSLVELMVENDLNRIELRYGEVHILLRRGQTYVTVGAAPVAAPTAPVHAPRGPDPAGTAPPAVASSSETYVRSPMVGTFYNASDPDSPPFVQIGSVVTPDTVVCLIEAMKVFNELKAECSGRITKVLARNAQAVEYDQPLFAVEPA